MTKTYRAILIDPEARQITALDWNGSLDDLHRLVGAEALDHFGLARWDEDGHLDTGWVDDGGLTRGAPAHAFLLPTSKAPLVGKCLIVGADERGETASCRIPVEILRADVTWLGLILPEVVWDETEHGSRAIVTYARVEAAVKPTKNSGVV